MRAANFRSQAAINGYKNLNNVVGKYFTEPDSLTGARSGPIPQDRGVGGGLPGSLLQNGAVSEPKLDPALQAKVNAAGPQGPSGPSGPAGPPGPTDGAATSMAPATLPTLIDTDGPVTLATNVSGRLHVTAESRMRFVCFAADSQAVAWVALDGEIVPSTYRPIAEGDQHTVTLTGITDSIVPAGAHEFELRVGCTGGEALRSPTSKT